NDRSQSVTYTTLFRSKEIREKYGDETVNKSNEKVLNMTEAEHEELTKLSEELHKTLAQAFATGDPASDLAQKAADLHKQWQDLLDRKSTRLNSSHVKS